MKNTGSPSKPPRRFGPAPPVSELQQLKQAETKLVAGLFDEAVKLHRMGRLSDAETIYNQILAAQPDHILCRLSLSVILGQREQYGAAIDQIDLALKVDPKNPLALNSKGSILLSLRRFEEVLRTYDRMLAVMPDCVDAHVSRGDALNGLGRAVEALASYGSALKLAPNHLDARYRRARTLASLRRHAEALAELDAVLRLEPKHVSALSQRGNVLAALKQPDLALAAYQAALEIEPTNAEVLNNRSIALLELGRNDEALESCERALAERPNYPQALYNKGNALRALTRYQESCNSYMAALALSPHWVDALNNLGLALGALGRPDEALIRFDQALALDSNHLGALHNRANALNELDRLDEALAACDRVLAVNPSLAETLNTRGVVLGKLSRYDEALASYERAISLRPDYVEARSNRGTALYQLKRYDEALVSYDEALALHPAYAAAHSNRGIVLKELGRFDAALASYDNALALQPDLADAHANVAFCHLLLGNFARGWQENEWRWETAQLKAAKRHFAQPLWRGARDIAGKTILLHAEQGFGDTIQFARYAPSVSALGARVILEVQAPLHTLMTSLPGAAQVISAGDLLPDFDLHCPLLSLPRAFETLVETVPAPTSYLTAPESKRNAWRNRLGAEGRPRIGLVWAGDPRKQLPGGFRIDRHRDIKLSELAPILQMRDCEFYSLQKGEDAAAQLRNSSFNAHVVDWSADFHDFSDTAALIENLDLVISVDTAVAHLAGALGKPVWLLNRHNTCWRWLRDRDDSPWYPTLRQFRQDATRDWGPVIARVTAALRDFTASF